MADVARLAGVSHQTVSRVLNDHRSVTAATRTNVEKAIAQLDYRRNTAARALVTRRTGVLGVVSVGGSHYGPVSTVIGIEAAARAEGYSVSLVSLEQVDRKSMQAALDHFTGAGVDGILVLSPTWSAVEAVHGLSAGVPVITIGGTTSQGRPTVVIDQTMGARLATAHLLDLGHSTVHHVRGPNDWLEAEARMSGWQAELIARGLPIPECLLGNWSAESGYSAGTCLAGRTDVTAVFVANDQMALGVLLALSESGRAVPDDVSLVGFDDTPEAAYLRPPLTTVRQDFTELGRRCLGQLVALIDGHAPSDRAPIAPELVVRRSSAPPP